MMKRGECVLHVQFTTRVPTQELLDRNLARHNGLLDAAADSIRDLEELMKNGIIGL